VLDPFIGSGTVAMAAEMYGRAWVGIELNQEYAEMAERRLAAWRQQQATMKTEPPASDRCATTSSTTSSLRVGY